MPGIRRFLMWARALIARGKVDDELTREMHFHLEMEVEKNIGVGMSPDEARRRALVDFGGVQRFRAEVTDERGGSWVSGLSIDLKLAWRMLRKSPGLTVVGVLGIALGVAVHVVFFLMISATFFPKVPLSESDRLVALEHWDVGANRPKERASLHEFVTWRDEMRSVQPIAAALFDRSDVVAGDGLPRQVSGVQMTAAGFQIARVPPLLGRYLLAEDEGENSPRVAVIGYDLWQHFFDDDPSVIGRRILVDGRNHEVVGVMPPGFAFPMNQSLWIALRSSPTRHARGDGPEVFVFGRLAPGATWEQAQAELTVIGHRTAAAFPETNAQLRPNIVRYTLPISSFPRDPDLIPVMELVATLLLIAITVNVAMLVFARTAMRQGEIAVRTALGATRGRIVGQLFVEALLLSLLGAGVGLAAGHVWLREYAAFTEQDGRPFWENYGLQSRTVAFALALAVVSAVIVGVVPGLKSTGRSVNAGLQLLGSGASLRLGRTWTALVVTQVAVVVTVLPTALRMGFDVISDYATRANFPAHELVTANVGVAVPIQPGMDGAAYRREATARFAVALPELERSLEAEPGVVAATIDGPGNDGPLEIEGVAGSAGSIIREGQDYRGVAPDYFEVLGARLLAGRDFSASDAGALDGGLIVSDTFVWRVLEGGPALGRRVRFVSPPNEAGQRVTAPWREIVGVVEDLYANAFDPERARSIVYVAVMPGQLQAATLLVRVRGGDADRFIPRLHQIAATGDLGLRIGRVSNLSVIPSSRFITAAVTCFVLALIAVLLLCVAGIHSLMSLTVTRRRKEIGIRIALGARPNRLLASIFSRAASQLGLGGLVGSFLGAALLRYNGETGAAATTTLGGVVVLMLVAGLVAAVGPARRGVGIHPMESLRVDD